MGDTGYFRSGRRHHGRKAMAHSWMATKQRHDDEQIKLLFNKAEARIEQFSSVVEGTRSARAAAATRAKALTKQHEQHVVRFVVGEPLRPRVRKTGARMSTLPADYYTAEDAFDANEYDDDYYRREAYFTNTAATSLGERSTTGARGGSRP